MCSSNSLLLQHGLINEGKDAIKEVKVGGLYTSITDLETFTSYYIKVSAFTKVNFANTWPGILFSSFNGYYLFIIYYLFEPLNKFYVYLEFLPLTGILSVPEIFAFIWKSGI